MPSPYMTQWSDPRWCEAQYNNRQIVADAVTYIERWPQWAEATRAKLPHRANIAYGPHAREVFDIFPAENAKGMFAFIHGGYWRALSKNDFSWIAEHLVAAGYSVAIITYPLAPEVTIGAIMDCGRNAIVKLWSEISDRERANLVLSGHSAGGHAVADLFATNWSARGLPASPFTGGLPISGVFELLPLVHTAMNSDIRLTPDTATAWSIDQRTPLVQAPQILAVGGGESAEFIRQSVDQAARWASHDASIAIIPERNHFNIVDELRDPASTLFGLAIKLLTAR